MPDHDADTRYWWTVGPDGWTIETWLGDPSPENVVTVGRVADYESAEALVKELGRADA